MEIKVLGSGCTKCNKLAETTKKAVEEMDINASITKEEDMLKILSYGVMSTPALVVDQEVLVSGRVPKIKEIKELLDKKLKK